MSDDIVAIQAALSHAEEERAKLAALLRRAHDELNGDECDKVRGVLLAQIREALGGKP